MESNILEHIRNQFPALDSEWVFMDNAGGSQTARQVGERIKNYLYHSNVQLGASYQVSVEAGERIIQSQRALSTFVNAAHPSEIILGPSTTQLLQNLSKSLVQLFKPGDEVIVTNCDHEANIGPWINMQKHGINIKIWEVNREEFTLDLDQLDQLMTNKTRLVAFTHVSNILGTINPVKEITAFIHGRGAMVCVDGVAYAPHRMIDVQDWDVDFYAFSFYKVYGPHYSLLYGKREILDKLPGINHFFIKQNEIPYKLQPGNVNYELTYGLLGVLDYFSEIGKMAFGGDHPNGRQLYSKLFEMFAKHEDNVVAGLIQFLNSKNNVKIIGEKTSDRNTRVPTISFILDGKRSSEIPLKVDPYNIGIRFGDFYARRLIEYLGLMEKDGVVRVSLVHYNTMEEVNNLIEVLDSIF
jgi:cysteine desulfurase family protein (TIGR01976 family)